jgi:hypothetical protein
MTYWVAELANSVMFQVDSALELVAIGMDKGVKVS